MTARLVTSDDADAVPATVAALRAGGLVVVPTDTVYGLAAAPAVAGATAGLFEAKGRGAHVPVAVLCASVEQALDLAELSDDVVADRATRWAAEHWPGPLTMVLPRRGGLAWDLGEPTATIGVRVPALDFVRHVAAEVGPIATTSANRHGHPTPATAAEAAASLVAPVALAVDGGVLESAASTVVDVAEGRILRSGSVVDLGL